MRANGKNRVAHRMTQDCETGHGGHPTATIRSRTYARGLVQGTDAPTRMRKSNASEQQKSQARTASRRLHPPTTRRNEHPRKEI